MIACYCLFDFKFLRRRVLQYRRSHPAHDSTVPCSDRVVILFENSSLNSIFIPW
jgi:hypothetical protein